MSVREKDKLNPNLINKMLGAYALVYWATHTHTHTHRHVAHGQFHFREHGLYVRPCAPHMCVHLLMCACVCV